MSIFKHVTEVLDITKDDSYNKSVTENLQHITRNRKISVKGVK